MPDLSTEIAHLETILNSGVETTTVDGMTVRYDFREVRKRLQELKALDDAQPARKRLFTTIRTSFE